jgi:hypothetical protein
MDNPEFEKMLRDFAEGKPGGIVMHVDTLRLLEPHEWDRLKEVGLDVAFFSKNRKKPVRNYVEV